VSRLIVLEYCFKLVIVVTVFVTTAFLFVLRLAHDIGGTHSAIIAKHGQYE
jgi:hypothetical protein